ncbi:hypothetical protein T07_4589 [Trichinella nelsoni]|uniref:Uncharacterized protein n=1 Tax=Trichinella nelsoni TaxID=6336 RepID=A0A0V0RFY7_9BILA|nr:hypothetical protein T07_4589 [Trichinella nelsoni]
MRVMQLSTVYKISTNFTHLFALISCLASQIYVFQGQGYVWAAFDKKRFHDEKKFTLIDELYVHVNQVKYNELNIYSNVMSIAYSESLCNSTNIRNFMRVRCEQNGAEKLRKIKSVAAIAAFSRGSKIQIHY